MQNRIEWTWKSAGCPLEFSFTIALYSPDWFID
jgi:hypothetical protein